MGRFQADIMLERAKQAFSAGQMDRARRQCEQLLVRNRKNAAALAILGQVAFAQNRLEEAAAHMLEAAAVRPDDPFPHLLLGEIRTFQGW
ncbi:MAG: tetratricopeptide repeat protein, partial [Planctomycetota bacterium]